MKKMNRFSMHATVAILLSVFAFGFYSCEKEKAIISGNDRQLEGLELLYSKDIHLADDRGNTLSFTIKSDNLDLIESYSEDNFVFRGLTYNELFNEESEEYLFKESDDIFEEDDYEEDFYDDFPLGNQFNELTIYRMNEVLSLKDVYVGYSIEVNWEAPGTIEDRAFTWHDEDPVDETHARVKNNRCCWAIYASWAWQRTSNSDFQDFVTNEKIKGGKTSPWYGKSQLHKLRISVRYRNANHRTVYYGTLGYNNPA